MSKILNRRHCKIWEMIGFIVNLSQMIEYNIANIIALNEILSEFEGKEEMLLVEYNELLQKAQSDYEKYSKKELGILIKASTKKNVFGSTTLARIDEVREKRNYYLHHFFKDDLFKKDFQERPKGLIPEIRKTISTMNQLNDDLVVLFEEAKQEVNLIY